MSEQEKTIEAVAASLSLARARLALEKAQASRPAGRPRIPGDRDGDGIAHEDQLRRPAARRGRGVNIPGPDTSHIGSNAQSVRMEAQLRQLDQMARDGDWRGIEGFRTNRNHPYARIVDDRRSELMLASPRTPPSAPDMSRFGDNQGTRRMRAQVDSLSRYAEAGNVAAIRGHQTTRSHPYSRVVDDYRTALLQHYEPEARVARLRGERPATPTIRGAAESSITRSNQRHIAELSRLADHHPNPGEALRAYSGISGNSAQARQARGFQQALIAHYSQGEAAGSAPLRPAASAAPTAPAASTARPAAPAATPTPTAPAPRAAAPAPTPAAPAPTPAAPPAQVPGSKTPVGSQFRIGDRTSITNTEHKNAEGKRVSLERVLMDRTRTANPMGLHPNELGFIPRPNVPLDGPRITRDGVGSRSFVDEAQRAHARAYLSQSTELQQRAREYQAGRWVPDTPEARAARAEAERVQRERDAQVIREAAAREATLRASVPGYFRPQARIGANVSSARAIIQNSTFRAPQFRDEASLKAFASSLIADYGGGPPPTKFRTTARVGRDEATIEYKGEDGTSITRRFTQQSDGSVEVYHAYFVAGSRGEGSGKAFFRTSMGEYIAAGVKSVGVTANIDVGGYAWARFGYLPANQGVWNSLRTRLKERLDRMSGVDAEAKTAMSRILDNPDRRSLWAVADASYNGRKLGKELLLGTNWSGKIDLSDQEQMRRFTSYVTQGDPRP